MALVALLVGLAVAVLWQTYRQGGKILDSVIAYYYTLAQGIFVGALIGLGACMIALRGGNVPEEVFLNLGGMFAAGVAVVPRSRGTDYRTAVEACRRSDSRSLPRRGPGASTAPRSRRSPTPPAPTLRTTSGPARRRGAGPRHRLVLRPTGSTVRGAGRAGRRSDGASGRCRCCSPSPRSCCGGTPT
jgi:hypothetical protein